MDTSPFRCFANIYHILRFFILLRISSAKHKVLVLVKFNLSGFFSWILSLMLYIKSYHQTQGHVDFSLMFSSRILIILHFTLRYMFHFELIFVKGDRFLSKFFLHKDVQLFQPPLVKTILSSRSFYATKAYMNICFPFSNISGSISYLQLYTFFN